VTTDTKDRLGTDRQAGGLQHLLEYRDLLLNLVRKEVRVRYLGASLGFAWSMVNPLIISLTYLFVFTVVFPSSIPHYPVFLVIGVVQWNLFSSTAMTSSELLVGNANLLKKVYFPRVAIPIASLLTNTVFWSSAFVVFLIILVPLGGHYSWPMLLFPVYMVFFLMLCLGIALLLATLHVEYRDSKHLVEVAIQVLFWLTPITYSTSLIHHAALRALLYLNPAVPALKVAHQLVYRGALPSIPEAVGLVFWSTFALWLGIRTFNRRVPAIIERL
jgi:lipopolysaccharide transport system permease protein